MILNSSNPAAAVAKMVLAYEQKFFAKYGVQSTVSLVRQIQIMVSGLGTGEIDLALSSGSTYSAPRPAGSTPRWWPRSTAG